MRSLLALRNSLQIQVERNALVGTELIHYRAPLTPMGLYAPRAVQLVHDKVRNFMRHRVTQVFLEVFGEYPGVVANPAAPAHELEHSRGSPWKVEQDRHRAKTPAEYILRLLHICFCRSDNLTLLKLSYRFYQNKLPVVTGASRPWLLLAA